MESNWQGKLHGVITWGQNAEAYLAKGIGALQGRPDVAAIIKSIPALAKFETQLLRLLPGVGTALTLADIAVSDLPAIIAFGAAMHFAPRDFSDPKSPGYQDRMAREQNAG